MVTMWSSTIQIQWWSCLSTVIDAFLWFNGHFITSPFNIYSNALLCQQNIRKTESLPSFSGCFLIHTWTHENYARQTKCLQVAFSWIQLHSLSICHNLLHVMDITNYLSIRITRPLIEQSRIVWLIHSLKTHCLLWLHQIHQPSITPLLPVFQPCP